MVGDLEHDIRDQLARYLAGEESLDAFQEWFASRAWGVEGAPLEARELINAINLGLAEFSIGHLSAVELARELRPWVETYRSVPEIQTGSSAQSLRPAVAVAERSGSVDIRLVAGHA
jgi:hypothetical protein